MACGRADPSRPPPPAPTCSAAKSDLADYDPQAVATLSWAFANLELQHGQLIAAVCTQARARASEFDGASCAQLLWALSRLEDGVDVAAVSVGLPRKKRPCGIASRAAGPPSFASTALLRPALRRGCKHALPAQ